MEHNQRKCVHLKLKSRTHMLLKEKLDSNSLSMQEIIEHICGLIVDDNPKINEIMRSYIVQKSENKVKLVKDKIPVKEIFNLLENSSPLKKG